MRMTTFTVATAMILACSVAPRAQGIVGGASEGARQGSHAAGPVGGVVGGVAGAIGGGIAGLIDGDQRPRFHEYVVEQHHRSFSYDRPVVVGETLPDQGVEYYEAPPEYGVKYYRYTIVNGEPVLVDPRTHRIVEVID